MIHHEQRLRGNRTNVAAASHHARIGKVEHSQTARANCCEIRERKHCVVAPGTESRTSFLRLAGKVAPPISNSNVPPTDSIVSRSDSASKRRRFMCATSRFSGSSLLLASIFNSAEKDGRFWKAQLSGSASSQTNLAERIARPDDRAARDARAIHPWCQSCRRCEPILRRSANATLDSPSRATLAGSSDRRSSWRVPGDRCCWWAS